MKGVKRGFLKYYLLKLLSEDRYSGYGLIKKIEEETGFWEPSTGSVYPLLESLEEDGLIGHEKEGQGKSWFVTEKGEKTYEEAREAKEKQINSLKQSLIVFSQAFNEEELKEMAERIEKGFKNPGKLRKEIKGLHHRLSAIADRPDCDEEKLIGFIDGVHEDLEELDFKKE